MQMIAKPDIYRKMIDRKKETIDKIKGIYSGFVRHKFCTFSSLEILLSIESGIMTRATAMIFMMILRGSPNTGGKS